MPRLKIKYLILQMPIVIFISCVVLIACSPRFPCIADMKTYFQDDRELLFVVANFLAETDFESVTIRATNIENGTMFVGLEYEHVPICSDEALKAIQMLFQRGYSIIGRSGNSIDFLRWSTRNHGRGIVYSIDGNTPDEYALVFLTEIEPLSIEGWYFYVENFYEWRNLNRE